MAACSLCNGSGNVICPKCKGTGQIDDGSGVGQTCFMCNGSGRASCPRCNGTGTEPGTDS